MFSSTFRTSGFIVNRKANKKRERSSLSSALQYSCVHSRARLKMFSLAALKFRGPVVALCIRYISRAHHRMHPWEKPRKRCARWYNIKSTVHLNINEPRWTNTFRRNDEHVIPRASNSRSSLARTKTTIQCRGIMYSISHIYISWYIHMRKIDGSHDGQSESGRQALRRDVVRVRGRRSGYIAYIGCPRPIKKYSRGDKIGEYQME